MPNAIAISIITAMIPFMSTIAILSGSSLSYSAKRPLNVTRRRGIFNVLSFKYHFYSHTLSPLCKPLINLIIIAQPYSHKPIKPLLKKSNHVSMTTWNNKMG